MEKQPAKVSYFFRQGYIDLWNTIRDSWRANINSALDAFSKGTEVWWVWKIFWWASGICVVIFGTLWFLALSLLHILILFIFFLIVYFLFTFTWVLDYLFRVKEKIFVACPNPGCYEKSSLPVYHCECGAAHTQLWPSKYGIWKRTCECGREIPCTFFNGREKLHATCPHCKGSMNTEEGTPLIIPVVGPPAAGKTTYLYSLIDILLSDEFSKKGYKVHSNINQGLISDSIRKLAAGQVLQKTTKEDKKAVDLIISKGSIKYAVYFYDYAGESFDASKNIEQHKFYSYFSAMIFLLDPFAIEQVRDEYYEQFNAYLKNSSNGGANPYDNAMSLDEVVATLTRNLAEHYSIPDKEKVKQSLAVIIPKTDILFDKFLSTDKDCRHFLSQFGQTSFIEKITWKFKTVRFFNAISKGTHSEGVLQPFEWILKKEITKKRIRRFFGNLLMGFFVAIVLGCLAFGAISAYNAISNWNANRTNTSKTIETPVSASLQTNYFCNTTELNVRSTPSANGKIIGKIKKGDEIYVYQKDITVDFAKIRYKDDIAYVSNKYITKKEDVITDTPSGITTVNINKTSSIIQIDDDYNAHEKKSKMTANERKSLKIDNISCITTKDYLVKGKTILKNNTGSIESILSIVDDHATIEYLISYDSRGNYIDCLEIGLIMYYAGDRASSIIEGDKIFYQSEWSEPGSESGTVYKNYQITPQLTFKELKTWEERNIESSTNDEIISQVNEITGIWEGWYEANQGKSKLILTIKDDMTGIFDFSNMPGMSNVMAGSYSVSVYNSDGTYLIKGKEWIKRPSTYVFLNLEGTISNGQFSGKTNEGLRFQLEQTQLTISNN